MRVKVGDQWFEVAKGQPLLVELTPADKQNISNMHPDASCYAIFDDADETSAEEKLAWMKA
jgi:hypothetical protein